MARARRRGAAKLEQAQDTSRPSGRAARQSRASEPAAGHPRPSGRSFVVERVQTGVRLEKRILKVLKALAEYCEISLGDLIEGIALHAFEGKVPFGPRMLRKIEALKQIYDLELDATASHLLTEQTEDETA